MMLPLVAAAADAVSQAPTLAVASASFLLSAAQWINSSRKGNHRDVRQSTALVEHAKKLDRIEGKVDDAIAQHATLNIEVVEIRAHVIGPDGKNGLRSRVEALERRSGKDRRTPGDES